MDLYSQNWSQCQRGERTGLKVSEQNWLKTDPEDESSSSTERPPQHTVPDFFVDYTSTRASPGLAGGKEIPCNRQQGKAWGPARDWGCAGVWNLLELTDPKEGQGWLWPGLRVTDIKVLQGRGTVQSLLQPRWFGTNQAPICRAAVGREVHL